ncbi:MAG: nucleoside triphosphate pyrophosphohydrolase [Clostridia bacterium]|nr:nucleoside triphosphate pyrophosphohydrolase [Clostridia bacterium]
MAVDYKFKDKYNIEDLLEIMKILRAPGGCPWDAEQNHESIKKNFIEETYEVVEAINKKDTELLKEELGDVMLQVVFHAAMEEEKGVFDFSDVADGICKKLIERHPHVFGDISVENTDEVLTNWDAIKRNSKKQKTTTQAMDSIPRELPALMRAEKLQSKAAKAGVDLKEDSAAYISQKASALSAGVNEKNLGELLFAVVAAARQNGIDPEDALTKISDEFLSDFGKYEKSTDEEKSSAVLYN